MHPTAAPPSFASWEALGSWLASTYNASVTYDGNGHFQSAHGTLIGIGTTPVYIDATGNLVNVALGEAMQLAIAGTTKSFRIADTTQCIDPSCGAIAAPALYFDGFPTLSSSCDDNGYCIQSNSWVHDYTLLGTGWWTRGSSAGFYTGSTSGVTVYWPCGHCIPGAADDACTCRDHRAIRPFTIAIHHRAYRTAPDKTHVLYDEFLPPPDNTAVTGEQFPYAAPGFFKEYWGISVLGIGGEGRDIDMVCSKGAIITENGAVITTASMDGNYRVVPDCDTL